MVHPDYDRECDKLRLLILRRARQPLIIPQQEQNFLAMYDLKVISSITSWKNSLVGSKCGRDFLACRVGEEKWAERYGQTVHWRMPDVYSGRSIVVESRSR